MFANSYFDPRAAFAHPLALKQISRKINKLDCCSAAPSVTSRYRSALPEFCDKLISVCISAAPWPAPTGAVTSWRALYGDELGSFLIFMGCCHPPPACLLWGIQRLCCGDLMFNRQLGLLPFTEFGKCAAHGTACTCAKNAQKDAKVKNKPSFNEQINSWRLDLSGDFLCCFGLVRAAGLPTAEEVWDLKIYGKKLRQ